MCKDVGPFAWKYRRQNGVECATQRLRLARFQVRCHQILHDFKRAYSRFITSITRRHCCIWQVDFDRDMPQFRTRRGIQEFLID